MVDGTRQVEAAASREAEKRHVARMQTTEGLAVRPFLGGTSFSVERATVEMAVFSAMVSSLPVGPGALVLDMGAGPCWVSDWLRKLRFQTCSVDICHDMLRIGRERMGPESWLCTGDMTAIPLRDESADAAVCYAALHHVPDWRAALREAHRVLRPGGVLVLQEPGRGHSKEAESITQMAQFGVLEQDLPPRALVHACRTAGFTRAIVRPVAELSHGLLRVLPPYPFFRHAPRLFLAKRVRRVLASVLERCLNLYTPLHLVVATKGTPYADSRRPDTMVARFQELAVPPVVDAGAPVPFRVRVLNTGLTRWLAKALDIGVGHVRLGMSLLDAERRITDLDFHREPLPRDVLPGESIELAGRLPPLPRPGRAGFRFDLVSEGVCWFSDKGGKPRYVDVEVRGDAG